MSRRPTMLTAHAPLSHYLSDKVTRSFDKILAIVRAHLGMDVAFISHFVGDERVFHYVDAAGRSPLIVGDRMELTQGYCHRVVVGALPELIPDTGAVPAALALPDTHTIPIGAHLSVPIRLSDGTVYGTFCCFSFSPMQSLNERDLELMRAFADLVAEQIEDQTAAARLRLAQIEQIHTAMDAGLPDIVLQPVFDLQTGAIVGAECLSRFPVEPRRGPDAWFAEARAADLGPDLELAAVRNAVAQARRLPADFLISVNVSAPTVLAGGLREAIAPLPLGRVVLEMTEHEPVEDYDALIRALAPLRAAGLRVAVDDAGAGYASLRHVMLLKPDVIKLDTSIIRHVDTDRMRQGMAAALVAFARHAGTTVVAEGIETEAEAAMLRKLRLPLGQGYLLARPMPVEDLIAMLNEAKAA